MKFDDVRRRGMWLKGKKGLRQANFGTFFRRRSFFSIRFYCRVIAIAIYSMATRRRYWTEKLEMAQGIMREV